MCSFSWLHQGLTNTIPTASQGAATNTAGWSWLPPDLEPLYQQRVNPQSAPEGPSHACLHQPARHRHTPSFQERSAERSWRTVSCLAPATPTLAAIRTGAVTHSRHLNPGRTVVRTPISPTDLHEHMEIGCVGRPADNCSIQVLYSTARSRRSSSTCSVDFTRTRCFLSRILSQITTNSERRGLLSWSSSSEEGLPFTYPSTK